MLAGVEPCGAVQHLERHHAARPAVSVCDRARLAAADLRAPGRGCRFRHGCLSDRDGVAAKGGYFFNEAHSVTASASCRSSSPSQWTAGSAKRCSSDPLRDLRLLHQARAAWAAASKAAASAPPARLRGCCRLQCTSSMNFTGLSAMFGSFSAAPGLRLATCALAWAGYQQARCAAPPGRIPVPSGQAAIPGVRKRTARRHRRRCSRSARPAPCS